MGVEIQDLISELLYGPRRAHRERATPEQMERNKREIAIQREIDERVRRKAHAGNMPTDSTDNTEQGDTP